MSCGSQIAINGCKKTISALKIVRGPINLAPSKSHKNTNGSMGVMVCVNFKKSTCHAWNMSVTLPSFTVWHLQWKLGLFEHNCQVNDVFTHIQHWLKKLRISDCNLNTLQCPHKVTLGSLISLLLYQTAKYASRRIFC